jgi:hypothetical protein
MTIMKKSKFLLPCVVCVAAVLILVSCKKGDTGPAGPAGPAGPTGAAGGQGPAGTANVIYSDWTDTATWVPDTVHNGATIDTVSYTAIITAPKLDLDMLNKGSIKVYIDASADPTDPTVLSLPYLGSTLYIDVLFYLNTIQMTSNGDLTNLPVRYILIPGGTTARTAKVIDWNNYAAVKAYLGLKN